MEQLTIFDYENKKEIQLMQWIPCKERLPDQVCWCIVTEWSTEERKWDVTMDKWEIKKDGSGEWAFANIDHVLAWMLMPEMYEEDKT